MNQIAVELQAQPSRNPGKCRSSGRSKSRADGAGTMPRTESTRMPIGPRTPRKTIMGVCRPGSCSGRSKSRSRRTIGMAVPLRSRKPASPEGRPGGDESVAMGTISRTASSGKAQSNPLEVKNQEILRALVRIAHLYYRSGYFPNMLRQFRN